MSGAMLPLLHTRRQQELHLYTAVCIDMRKKLQCQLDRLRFQGTAAALCFYLSACCDGCSALARVFPRPPMIDGRVMNLIKAISQRWQQVIARGNKMVWIRDDLSVRNERGHCCSCCNEVKFNAREGHFDVITSFSAVYIWSWTTAHRHPRTAIRVP